MNSWFEKKWALLFFLVFQQVEIFLFVLKKP